MRKELLLLFSISFAVILVASPSLLASPEEKPIVVTTTSVLGTIVKNLAGNKVDVITLVNPSICPAMYDIKPSDVWAVSHAKIVFYHGFEPWIKRLMQSSGSKAPLVKVPGPWNTPDALKEKYREVASALEKYLGINVTSSLNRELAYINQVEGFLKNSSQKYHLSQYKAIVMEWQKAFVSWLGIQIVATYPPPARMSSKEVAELEQIGKEKGVELVISNLQSGTSFGAELAKELGAVHVVLTNFPLSSPGVKNVTSMMKYNLEQIINGITQYNAIKEVKNSSVNLTSYYKEVKSASVNLTPYYVAIGVLAAIAVGEGVALYVRRRRS